MNDHEPGEPMIVEVGQAKEPIIRQIGQAGETALVATRDDTEEERQDG